MVAQVRKCKCSNPHREQCGGASRLTSQYLRLVFWMNPCGFFAGCKRRRRRGKELGDEGKEGEEEEEGEGGEGGGGAGEGVLGVGVGGGGHDPSLTPTPQGGELLTTQLGRER